jgi:hypothetical protein
MKKWLILLVLLVFTLFILAYFFVPKTEQYSYVLPVKCTQAAASRYVLNTARWPEWWPGAKTTEQLYHYSGVQYRINNLLVTSVETTVLNGTDSTHGYFQIMPNGVDSCFLVWTSSFVRSSNPFKRTIQLFQSGSIKNNISSMLSNAKNYFEREDYIYGMKIEKQKVTDSCMVSLKQTFDHYPSTAEIYGMISSVKEFIKTKNGEETKSPMMHVHQEAPAVYEAMVAIPTRNEIATEGKFQLKKFMIGYMLVSEVTGGVVKVLNAEKEMDNYVKDYQKMSPAIPFQLLITDRMKEPDSNKWVTRLYCPIFN